MKYLDKADLAQRLNVQARFLPDAPELYAAESKPLITQAELMATCRRFGFSYGLIKNGFMIVEEPTE